VEKRIHPDAPPRPDAIRADDSHSDNLQLDINEESDSDDSSESSESSESSGSSEERDLSQLSDTRIPILSSDFSLSDEIQLLLDIPPVRRPLNPHVR